MLLIVCSVFVPKETPRDLASGLSDIQTHKPYNNFLIAPACIFTLCIARYLMQNIGISIKGAINRGSYMSAHVLLNLLNELGKRDKMRGLPSI